MSSDTASGTDGGTITNNRTHRAASWEKVSLMGQASKMMNPRAILTDIERAEAEEKMVGDVKWVDRDGLPAGFQYAMRCGCKSFALAYFLRFGVSVGVHYFTSMRKNPSFFKAIFMNDLEKLVGENSLKGRVNAVQWAQLAGCFTFVFHTVRWLLRKYKMLTQEWGTFAAGCLGGVSIVFWQRDSWRILSLYVFARSLGTLAQNIHMLTFIKLCFPILSLAYDVTITYDVILTLSGGSYSLLGGPPGTVDGPTSTLASKRTRGSSKWETFMSLRCARHR